MVARAVEVWGGKTGSKMERKGMFDRERVWIQARERATQEAETVTVV